MVSRGPARASLGFMKMAGLEGMVSCQGQQVACVDMGDC
jgi:hypothetical protein